MINKRFQKLLHKGERGQAIILVAFALIGLVAMVGLVVDTGILLIEYGKLKRGVDAAAVAAAQQYRLPQNATVLDTATLENAARNFLQLNQSTDITAVTVHSCEDAVVASRPALCNPDPTGHPNDNRKLVEVVASKTVRFGFLPVIGIRSTTITADSVGEAATVDLVLIIDTSASMAFETDTTTGKNPFLSDSNLEDPSVCNTSASKPCQPMKAVKDVALDFLDTLYFPYDRVAVIPMTSQYPGGPREVDHEVAINPYIDILPLTSDKNAVIAKINDLSVFEPRVCDNDPNNDGSCLFYEGSTFKNTQCRIWELMQGIDPAAADPSSCPSSNVGGALNLARSTFTDPFTGVADPNFARLDAFWVVVTLLGGPANASDPIGAYTNGVCPEYTWTYLWDGRFCQDKYPSIRHADTDTASYTNPVNNTVRTISMYDPDDYARDMADGLATLISGEGVTIYTIGLGTPIKDITKVAAGEDPPAESLLRYIAECAGENSPDDCETIVTNPQINHGQYFFAPTNTALADIFDRIAKNIATKISQ